MEQQVQTPEPSSLFLDVPPQRASRRGCFAIAFGILLVIVLVVVLLQRWMAPEVNASDTRPVVVSHGVPADPRAGADGDETDVGSELAGGGITSLINQQIIDAAAHPFDPLLEIAERCLQKIDAEIHDYTATLVSQVRVNGKIMDEKYLTCKIRHAQKDGTREIPFSVYTLFLKPESNVGQEAIWVEGWHYGNLVAHTTGLLNVKRFYLDPDGSIAMRGNRHPIREIGFRNLLVKMVKIGAEDRNYGECQVTVERNVKINDRSCTVLKVVHPVERDYFEFHIAKIYIDDERDIPIAYEGYGWPEREGAELPLFEKYYYTDVQLNIGLTDADFDPGNEDYNYPKW